MKFTDFLTKILISGFKRVCSALNNIFIILIGRYALGR